MSTILNQSRQYQGKDRQYKSEKGGQQPSITHETLAQIILNGDAVKMVEEADKLGNQLARTDNLMTSQIRAIFGEVRRLQGLLSFSGLDEDISSIHEQKESAFRKLYLLKPKMAYRKEKEKGYGVKNLVAVLDPALILVFQDVEKREERFVHFIEFFEAILAYHRAYGGI